MKFVKVCKISFYFSTKSKVVEWGMPMKKKTNVATWDI